MTMLKNVSVILLMLFLAACNTNNSQKEASPATTNEKGSYGYDAAFLKANSINVVELENGNAKVLLSPDYQGRVMTSTSSGDTGASYGWINYSLVSSVQKKKQFNPFG